MYCRRAAGGASCCSSIRSCSRSAHSQTKGRPRPPSLPPHGRLPFLARAGRKLQPRHRRRRASTCLCAPRSRALSPATLPRHSCSSPWRAACSRTGRSWA
jgi:hypothetical protein